MSSFREVSKFSVLFGQLDAIFKFDLDVAADIVNHMTPRYLTAFEDGRIAPWNGKRIWCNPPYDVRSLSAWVGRAIAEAEAGKLVCFHMIGDPSLLAQYIFPQASCCFIPLEQIYEQPSMFGFFGKLTNAQREGLYKLPGTVQGR